MRIERATLREVPLPLERPFESSTGTVSERRVLLLRLQAEGLEAWGECVAPATPYYTYETTETAWHILTSFVLPKAIGRDATDPATALEAAAGVRGHPMAKATLEMAMWDLAARARGVGLAELLGGTRRTVAVGVSVGMMQADALLDAVASYLGEGYSRIKVKIGRGKDVAVLGALRECFPDVALWADANSAYTMADVGLLRELDPLGLEMLEEPLAPGSLLDYARLAELIGTPLCLDESIGSASDAALAVQLGSCAIVNLKPGRVGGLAESLRLHDALAGAGFPLWCGGMLETGIGRAHNLALASLPGFTLPGDISASRRYWTRDIVEPEFEVVDGTMAVPTGPGLGVEVDAERVEALAVRTADFA